QRISVMKRAGWLAHPADSLSVTLGATLATFPLTAYSFGIVSLVGLPATFFAMLSLPGIILVSAAAAALGLFLYPLAQLFAWVDWLFLSYFIQVVRAFDALPFASRQIAISAWQVWGYYVFLAAGLAAYSYKQVSSRLLSSVASGCRKATATAGGLILARPQLWCLGFLLAASLAWAAALTQPDDRLHVSFLDVGQGDAVLISRGAQQVLIDGGPNAGRIALELGERIPFHDREIELVVSTQPQADHLAGLVEVARRYRVGRVAEPGLTSESATYQRWQKVMDEARIPRHVLRAGYEIDLGRGVKIEVLNPPQPFLKGTSDDLDNNGLALRLVYGEVSFLFTADIRQDAERELVGQRARLASTVLKVAHHGSRTSTGDGFLHAVSPEAAVICSGKDNPFGHPHREVLERLKSRLGNQVYLTATQGTVEFITDGKRLWVTTDRQ
ncbi:MAG: ComEC/Rec2 family competence protein, partial [Chloroflexota bacterium]